MAMNKKEKAHMLARALVCVLLTGCTLPKPVAACRVDLATSAGSCTFTHSGWSPAGGCVDLFAVAPSPSGTVEWVGEACSGLMGPQSMVTQIVAVTSSPNSPCLQGGCGLDLRHVGAPLPVALQRAKARGYQP